MMMVTVDHDEYIATTFYSPPRTGVDSALRTTKQNASNRSVSCREFESLSRKGHIIEIANGVRLVHYIQRPAQTFLRVPQRTPTNIYRLWNEGGK